MSQNYKPVPNLFSFVSPLSGHRWSRVCALSVGMILLSVSVWNVFAETAVVTIPRGSSVRSIATILQMHKVIPQPLLFRAVVTLSGNSRNLKSGEYELPLNDSVFDIEHLFRVTKILTAGAGIMVQLTIPEGLTKAEIFQRLANSELVNEKKYAQIDKGPDILQKIQQVFPGVTDTEGFYFPDTYFFSKRTSEKKILFTLVDNFMNKAADEVRRGARQTGLTPYELLTLASIIEKETGHEMERDLISSVFHNRLIKNIPLATDPTVIYGIKDFDGNLRRVHLRAKSPYNTYVNQGLTPTPISNPGILSIQAAANPADSDYLFFVAKGDGTSYFSKTLADHNRAVRRYQLNRKSDYRSH